MPNLDARLHERPRGRRSRRSRTRRRSSCYSVTGKFTTERRPAQVPVRHAGARPSRSRTRRPASTSSIFEHGQGRGPRSTRRSASRASASPAAAAMAYKHKYPARFDRDDLYVSRYKFTLTRRSLRDVRGVQRLRPRVHHRPHLAHGPVGAARRARGAQQRRRADARRRRALPLLAHPVAARDRVPDARRQADARRVRLAAAQHGLDVDAHARRRALDAKHVFKSARWASRSSPRSSWSSRSSSESASR